MCAKIPIQNCLSYSFRERVGINHASAKRLRNSSVVFALSGCFSLTSRTGYCIIFSVLLPLFLLFIFKQINIPNESYELHNFTPGIVVFGFSFITLFTAMLVSKDRTSSLLIRLGISPMKPIEYILSVSS